MDPRRVRAMRAESGCRRDKPGGETLPAGSGGLPLGGRQSLSAYSRHDGSVSRARAGNHE
ncbi:MAG: hypothetical protein HY921_09735 [Elusimicrobia bacterium]|nr:hypothetical protein [Elusimicrobiota bacterium]